MQTHMNLHMHSRRHQGRVYILQVYIGKDEGEAAVAFRDSVRVFAGQLRIIIKQYNIYIYIYIYYVYIYTCPVLCCHLALPAFSASSTGLSASSEAITAHLPMRLRAYFLLHAVALQLLPVQTFTNINTKTTVVAIIGWRHGKRNRFMSVIGWCEGIG